MSIEKNTDYFGDKSESERMRNVANMIHDVVNVKPDETLEETPASGEGTEEFPESLPEPEVNPLVELVGKTISAGKPKGFFMQGVQSDDNPKL